LPKTIETYKIIPVTLKRKSHFRKTHSVKPLNQAMMGYPFYPFPAGVLLQLASDALRNKSRSFRRDARLLADRLRPPMIVTGVQYIPQNGPCLLTVNHYSRPGFNSWWLALAISALLPAEVHWIITAAWNFTGRWYRPLLRPSTQWAFKRLAIAYGFSTMPPMPPSASESQARAESIRHVMNYIRRTPRAVVGLAPEGREYAGGILGDPPPGTGRFMLQMARQGLTFVPAAIYEQDSSLHVSFGPPYSLVMESAGLSENTDSALSRLVMEHIACMLPQDLRGAFGSTIIL
jgi:hypothetical protein